MTDTNESEEIGPQLPPARGLAAPSSLPELSLSVLRSEATSAVSSGVESELQEIGPQLPPSSSLTRSSKRPREADFDVEASEQDIAVEGQADQAEPKRLRLNQSTFPQSSPSQFLSCCELELSFERSPSSSESAPSAPSHDGVMLCLRRLSGSSSAFAAFASGLHQQLMEYSSSTRSSKD